MPAARSTGAAALAAALTALAAGSPAARAQDGPPPDAWRPKRHHDYWHLSFSGGAMGPLAPLDDTHRAGLAAGVSFGWRAENGLGATVNAQYAPLPAVQMDRVESRETHLGAATITPRFTLGRGLVRGWIAAGGGLVLDYTETELASTGVVDSAFVYEPAAVGSAGLELHAFDSGGLLVSGRYVRTLRSEPEYQMVTVTGGLVLTFR